MNTSEQLLRRGKYIFYNYQKEKNEFYIKKQRFYLYISQLFSLNDTTTNSRQ